MYKQQNDFMSIQYTRQNPKIPLKDKIWRMMISYTLKVRKNLFKNNHRRDVIIIIQDV